MNLSLLTVLCHGKNNSQLKELLKNNKILNFINTFIKDKPYYETPFRFLKLLSKMQHYLPVLYVEILFLIVFGIDVIMLNFVLKLANILKKVKKILEKILKKH